jgi:hypothetical protein
LDGPTAGETGDDSITNDVNKNEDKGFNVHENWKDTILGKWNYSFGDREKAVGVKVTERIEQGPAEKDSYEGKEGSKGVKSSPRAANDHEVK